MQNNTKTTQKKKKKKTSSDLAAIGRLSLPEPGSAGKQLHQKYEAVCLSNCKLLVTGTFSDWLFRCQLSQFICQAKVEAN